YAQIKSRASLPKNPTNPAIHRPPPPRTKPLFRAPPPPTPHPRALPSPPRHEASRRERDHTSIREAVQIHGGQLEAPPVAARRGGPRPGARPLLPPPPPEPRLLRLRGARPPRHRRRAPAPRRRGDPHRQVHPPRLVPPHRPRARPPRGPRAPPRLAQARHRALLPLRQLSAQVLPRAHHREHQGRGWGRRHVHGRRAARLRHRGEVGAGLQEGRHERRRRAAPGGRRGVPPQGGGAHVRCGVACGAEIIILCDF
ncbi:unnamed protein product, partial [Urochloa humidicola]